MIKDSLFQTRQYQQTIEIPTRQVKDIYAMACRMLKKHYKWKHPIRALGISGFLLAVSYTHLLCNRRRHVCTHGTRTLCRIWPFV